MTDKQQISDRPQTVDEEIDKASADSFPASDPPSWSGGQEQDSPVINPVDFDRRRRAEERKKYRSDEPHDGR